MTPIRADLAWSTTCVSLGLKATGNAPVLTLCRRLITAGHDPATPMEVYRGSTLALKVGSIGEGAKLTVEECSDGRPRLRPYRQMPSEGSLRIAPNEKSGEPPSPTPQTAPSP